MQGRFFTRWTQLQHQESNEKKSTQVEMVNEYKMFLIDLKNCRPAEHEISMMQVPSEYSKTGQIAQKS